MRAVRTARFKYIKNFGVLPKVYLPLDVYSGRAGYATFMDYYYYGREAEELYDLESDPHELKNVINQPAYRHEAQRLRAIVDKWMQDTEDPLLKGDIPPTPEQARRQADRRYYNR